MHIEIGSEVNRNKIAVFSGMEVPIKVYNAALFITHMDIYTSGKNHFHEMNGDVGRQGGSKV